MLSIPRPAVLFLLLASAAVAAQQPQPTTAAQAPIRDTSYIDAQGTAHVTRVVPVPATISAEAQASLRRAEPDQGPPEPLDLRRSRTDAWALTAAAAWSKLCPNQLV
jgi:monoterpene epsilon-lactone hydrolase